MRTENKFDEENEEKRELKTLMDYEMLLQEIRLLPDKQYHDRRTALPVLQRMDGFLCKQQLHHSVNRLQHQSEYP